jgi:nucleoside-diphosphate-sugar epimerase
MKALVTGAGGFLGGAIARALLERGDQVRSFSRGEYARLGDLGVEHVQGDIGDAQAVSTAVEGVDVVFHTAAKVAAAGRIEDFRRTNVEGARNVMAACRKHGVPVMVHTSTPSVTFGPGDLEGVDESVGYSDQYDAFYGMTKAEGERAVLGESDGDFRTVAIRPHLVWGPGDTSLLPRLLQRARSGQLRRIGGPAKKTDVTYVDDAVRAHLLAADRLLEGGETADRVAGRPYFVSSGEPIEIWEFVNRLLAAADVDPIEKRVNLKVAFAAAWVMEKVHALSGADGEPRMNRWIVRELTTARWFDISAAKRDLGYEPAVSIDEGMRRLASWLEERGGEARA